MILNQAQAEAIYSAMCALNNVCHCFTNTTQIHGDHAKDMITVKCNDGSVEVQRGALQIAAFVEYYPDHSAFATAYGLQQG